MTYTTRTNEETPKIERALFLAGLIARPCTDRKSWNLKREYIEEAKAFIEETRNEVARGVIESVLKVYSN